MMKKLAFICAAFPLFYSGLAQGVTVGSPNPPDPSATLEIAGNTGGLLLPRLTTAERNAIPNPAEGLQIYNLTTHCLEIYFPSIGWTAVKCDCSQAPPQPGAITGNTTVCLNGLGVTYSINAVPGAISYTWTVPPGASIASGQGTTSITVNYGTQPGTVSVTADNTCGSSSQVSVNITQSSVNANFTASPATPNVNTPAVFTPAFTQPGTNYQWTFASGSPSTSTGQNPSVTWTQTGTYVVGLIVTDVNGCSDTVSQNVTVTNCPPPLTQSISFQFTGAVQTWVVPSCVTVIQVDASGAQGGTNNGIGGAGGRVQATLSVTPGETLSIYVGGQPNPFASAGYNGGGLGLGTAGGGGGASDIRRNGTALTDRILVAGGGGGGGQGNGGAGGGLTGGQGSTNGNGVWAQGGTQSSGGAGGMYNNGGCAPGAAFAPSGTFGIGGNGLSNSACCCYGAGGGGGWYGGGGMQINGAGGGSSYVTTNGSSGVTHTQGSRSGNGVITIVY